MRPRSRSRSCRRSRRASSKRRPDPYRSAATSAEVPRIDRTELSADDESIEEQQCSQCLVLRRRANASVRGEMGEEVDDFRRSHVGGVAHAVEVNEAPDPAHVGTLGAKLAMTKAELRAQAVQESRRALAL